MHPSCTPWIHASIEESTKPSRNPTKPSRNPTKPSRNPGPFRRPKGAREDQKCALCVPGRPKVHTLRTLRKMAQTEQSAQFCVGLIIFGFMANPTGEITAAGLLSREDTLTAVPPKLTFYGRSSRNEQFTAVPPGTNLLRLLLPGLTFYGRSSQTNLLRLLLPERTVYGRSSH